MSVMSHHARPRSTMLRPELQAEAFPAEGSIDRRSGHPKNAESREFSLLLFQTQQKN